MNLQFPRWILAALAVIALAAGLAVGHVSAPGPASGDAPGQARSPLKPIGPAPEAAPPPAAPEAQDVSLLSDPERIALAELKASNAQLERQREQLRATLAAARQSAKDGREFVLLPPSGAAPAAQPSGEAPSSTPIPFPVNLPEAFTPAGFERVTLATADVCKDLGLDVVALDCSEFPCIAWTEITGKPRTLSMSSCAPWSDAFTSGTSLHGYLDRSTTPPRRFFAFIGMPAEKSEDMGARIGERLDGMKVALGLE